MAPSSVAVPVRPITAVSDSPKSGADALARIIGIANRMIFL